MLKKKKNDIIIWGAILVLIISSFTCFYYFSEYLFITRIFLLLFAFFISILLFANTYLGKFYWSYIKESFREVYAITWPTGKETFQTTLVISAVVLVMGIILFFIDIL